MRGFEIYFPTGYFYVSYCIISCNKDTKDLKTPQDTEDTGDTKDIEDTKDTPKDTQRYKDTQTYNNTKIHTAIPKDIKDTYVRVDMSNSGLKLKN